MEKNVDFIQSNDIIGNMKALLEKGNGFMKQENERVTGGLLWSI